MAVLIQDILFDFCIAIAAWAPVNKKAFLFAGSAERPADIILFIPNYSCGKSLLLDNAVTCPLQHKYVVNAAQPAGFACNIYVDQIKSKSFESSCSFLIFWRVFKRPPRFLFKTYKKYKHAL